MTALRVIATAIVVCLPVAATAAQTAATEPATQSASRPARESRPVVEFIPAVNLGFVIVNDVIALTDNVDQYLADTGLNAMVLTDGALPEIVRLAQLGDGFNPGGGFAAVMLPPNPFDPKLLRFMGFNPASDDETPKLPLVFFVPGNSIESVFGKHRCVRRPAEKFTKVDLSGQSLFAAMRDGYVVLSPSELYLRTALQCPTGARLTKKQAAVIARNDIALHVNMRASQLYLRAGIAVMEYSMAQHMSGGIGWLFTDPNTFFGMLPYHQSGFYHHALNQMEAFTVAGRKVTDGLLAEFLVTWKADSTFARAYADNKGKVPSLTDRLVDYNPIFVLGAADAHGKAGNGLAERRFRAFLAKPHFARLPKSLKKRILANKLALHKAVTSWQMVIGGPRDAGLFGSAMVLRCKDAEKTKDLLHQLAKLVEESIAAITKQPSRARAQGQGGGHVEDKLTFTSLKCVEMFGQIAGDAIEISHPSMDDMGEDGQAQMAKILGEDKIRFLLAAPDRNTVVVTFGGSRSFMDSALAAAKGGGTIGKAPHDLKAMVYMPPNPSTVVMFNVGNYFDVALNGTRKMVPEFESPFTFAVESSVIYASQAEGNTKHGVLFVPTDAVREIVGLISRF